MYPIYPIMFYYNTCAYKCCSQSMTQLYDSLFSHRIYMISKWAFLTWNMVIQILFLVDLVYNWISTFWKTICNARSINFNFVFNHGLAMLFWYMCMTGYVIIKVHQGLRPQGPESRQTMHKYQRNMTCYV